MVDLFANLNELADRCDAIYEAVVRPDGERLAIGCDAAPVTVVASDGATTPTRAPVVAFLPGEDAAMTWRVGNHGFEMTLSPRVPSLIVRHLRPWLENWLAQSGRRLGDIRSWAVHPGGPRILSSVAEALDLPPSATAVSRDVLAECGNMSSPTVLFVLDRLREQAAPGPIVALAFGPGLVAESALLES